MIIADDNDEPRHPEGIPDLIPWDEAEVWPEEVADARPLAAEALRRYEAGEIEDGEYYPAEAVRHRILHERAKGYQPEP